MTAGPDKGAPEKGAPEDEPDDDAGEGFVARTEDEREDAGDSGAAGGEDR